MAFEFLKSWWKKTLFIILLVLVLLIALCALLINRYWSPILSDKLKSTVASSTDSLYQINFDKAELQVLSGRITILNLTLKPDTAVYQSMKQAHLAPNNLYAVHVKKLVLNHIHPFKLYFKHKLDIGEIILSAPELSVSYQLNHAKDTVVKDKRTIYQKISKSLKMIHVGKVMLNDVMMRYVNHKGPKTGISEFKELNLSATDLLIDSATQFDKTRFLYCREMAAELNNYSGKSANGLYTYKARQLTFSTKTSQLNAYGFSLKATQSPGQFFAKTYQDRFIINLDTLQLNNFDFEIYNKYHTIYGSKLTLSKGGVNIFSNPRIDPKSFKIDKVITFPNEALHLVPAYIKIDTVKIHKINLTYEEYNLKTRRSGQISFNDINGHLHNVTNNPVALKKNNIANADLICRFMNKGNLNVHFTFNLTDKMRSFSYKANLSAMNLSAINQATVPLASVAVKSGQLTNLSFDVHANSKTSAGRVTFLYNNLKVQLLKADTAEKKMHKMGLATLLANALIVKRNNPDNDGDQPRSAVVTYKRISYFPFFKSIWQTLLSGIKPCVGLDKVTQKNIKAKIDEHQKYKLDHDQKKALKKQQHEEKKRLKALKKAQDKAKKKLEAKNKDQ